MKIPGYNCQQRVDKNANKSKESISIEFPVNKL
jgi:hypothetical protein